MSKPRRMTINPAKLRAAIALSQVGRPVNASRMNEEEWSIFRLIMAGYNNPFDGADSEFRAEVKGYMRYWGEHEDADES